MKVAVIGECMVELNKNGNTFLQAFGGDTLNCAIYLQRTAPKVQVEYVTVLGDDIFSKKMYEFFKKEHLGCNYIDFLEKKSVGLYLIDTIDGERSFAYYRDTSAPKELFNTSSLKRYKREFLEFDMIYFSAITLAIMKKDGRANLFKLLKKARKNGVKIAYDPNYRERLYKSIDEAKKLHKKALKVSDIYLPSLEDERSFQSKDMTFKNTIENAKKYGVKDVVVKNGKESIYYTKKDKFKNQKSQNIHKVIDTTAAGDSFNGAYLGSRLKGLSKKDAIKFAKEMAAKVIMYKGAIIPKEKM